MRSTILAGAIAASLVLASSPARGEDGARLLSIDHYVRVRSAVPAIEGQLTQIYVRERLRAGTVLRGGSLAGRVVLFVHGAGTPAEVAFDVPYQDYSWMAYLAEAGFDVFSMDMTGYGRSTRPAPMNDPCNLAPEGQAGFVPVTPCESSYPQQMTTLASDWHDIDAVVDHLRALRGVERVSLVGWSLGGPRAAGYAARHPEKVDRIVLLAPAYNRNARAEAPAEVPARGATLSTQSRADFVANWDRQVGCANQVDPAAAVSVWSEMLASDPVGATWGPGVRRAPLVTSWGWTQAVVMKTATPMLLVAAVHDKQVSPDRVREMYADLGATQKVLLDLGCSSHNAMWETNHLLLFAASREWLTSGTVEGQRSGVVRLGYADGSATR
jgi:pimeloyl-ACP methyl ester carboxylesterase